MSREPLNYKISDEYSHEINDIKNKLSQLERGRVYELSRAQMDGYLATNVGQLRDMLNELIYKIQNGEDGTGTELADIMKSMYF